MNPCGACDAALTGDAFTPEGLQTRGLPHPSDVCRPLTACATSSKQALGVAGQLGDFAGEER